MNFVKKLKKIRIVQNLKEISFIKQVYAFVVYGLFRKPSLSRQIEIQIGKKISFRLDYFFGSYKYGSFGDRHNAGFKKWIECCKDKLVVFDVGAHIGLYSIPAGKVIKKDGEVYAFEPSTANCRYLRKHIEYNNCRNISVQPFLVGERNQTNVEFFENKIADAMNSLIPGKNLEKYQKVLKSQISLDDFCHRENIFPQVIKIDVEGAELRVLKGAEKMLKKQHPPIFLRVHPKRLVLLNEMINDLKQLIISLGYSIYDSEGNVTGELKFGEYILSTEEI